MIEHTGVAVSDYKRAKDFYLTALAPLGYELKRDYEEYGAAGFMEGGHTDFWVMKKDKPQPSHVAFRANSKEAVDAFYKAGLEAGGKDNGAPGYRKDYSPGYYAAFILDPDGSNIETVWFDPALEK
ncbi:VOC family protein [Candidatus Kaiserbacteria bacterium]|nr:VOC family protein [Candidatus Kaiserbacteria bacterium]